MPSDLVNENTREEWRDLGFFYDFDPEGKNWRIKGSRESILKFCGILEGYSTHPKNARLSEHEHYGPYMYLKLTTWSEAIINDTGIHGRPQDFERLSHLVRHQLDNHTIGGRFIVGAEYSDVNKAELEFEIFPDATDPAELDPCLTGDSPLA